MFFFTLSLSQGITIASPRGGASDSRGGISSKIRTALKRKKKSKKSKDETEELNTANSTTTLGEEDEEEDEQEEESGEGEGGFTVITQRTLTQAERELNKQVLKSGQFTWVSHRCLMEGLQGVTLRALACGPRLYLCGGATATGTPNTQVFYCSARHMTHWAKLTQTAPQFYYASLIINRELVLIGGISVIDQKCTRLISTYDIQEKSWVEVLPPLPTGRSAAAAVTWGDYVIVLGGTNDASVILDTVEILHLPSQQWSTAFSLPFGVAGASAVIYRSRLYVLGGLTNEGLSRAFFSVAIDRLLATTSRINRLTSTSSNVWEFHPDCPYTMMSLCSFNGYLLALGGNEMTVSVTQPGEWVWCFFPEVEGEGSSWILVQKMHTARKLCCAVSLSSTSLAVIGGSPYFSVVDLATIELPSPSSSPSM